jgi:hypothetical protein
MFHWHPRRVWILRERVDFPNESAVQRQDEFKDLAG